ncbi:hypothetical protein CW310_22965 [Pseudomonas citronellolis]|uniref:hypothetical protein n=1 Tax=Pseudomonas citronellolis TaxID=53408 RepID=UPI00094567E2|nr:hypothetical protein [Pseudomonas citronellolis]TGC24231.1 hypothetical protein CW310_22965 [Pseudomonas citronellolis]
MNASITKLPRCKTLRKFDELSFVDTYEDGHCRRFDFWSPARVEPKIDQWNIDFAHGLTLVRELQMLQKGSERNAFLTLRNVFSSPNWRVCGHGVEDGFATGIAALAIIGMRALQAGATPFDPDLE